MFSFSFFLLSLNNILKHSCQLETDWFFSANFQINTVNLLDLAYCAQIKYVSSYILTAKLDIKKLKVNEKKQRKGEPATPKNYYNVFGNIKNFLNAKSEKYFKNSHQ